MSKEIIYKDNIAYGYVIPKESPDTMAYLANVRDYNSQPSDIKKQIKLCNQIILWEGQVGNAIDILTEFAIAKMRVVGVKNTKAKKVIDWWVKNLNKNAANIGTGIHPFNKQAAIEFFRSGNPLIYKNWSKIKTEVGNYDLPTETLLINPMNIDIPDASVEFGSKVFIYEPPSSVAGLLTTKPKDLSEEEKIIVESIPKDFKKNFKDGRAIFTSEQIYHIMRKGVNYRAWGTPYLTRVFNAVANKRKIQALDSATAEGMINRVLIFKIGDPDHPATFEASRLAAFARLIQNPSPSLTIVWSFDVQVEDTSPDPGVLDFEHKYNQVNKEILESMGIPVSILEGDVRGDPYVAIATLMERLEDFRSELEGYYHSIVDEILERNNFKPEDYSIRWGRSRLRNTKEFRELTLTMYDRGLISKTTALEEGDYDIEEEAAKRDEEAGSGRDDLFMPPQMPFSGTKQPGPDNSGVQPDKTTTKKPKTEKPDIKDNPESKGEVYDIYSNFIKGAYEKIKNESSSKEHLLLKTMIIPSRTEEFVKSLMTGGPDVGLAIDELLNSKTKKQNDKFKKKMKEFYDTLSLNDFKNNALGEIMDYAIEFSSLLERSMKFEI